MTKEVFDNEPNNPVNDPISNNTCLNCEHPSGDFKYCSLWCEEEYNL